MMDDNFKTNVNLWTDILKKDQQWDFSFLEKIILHKVKLMREFYIDGNSSTVQESVDEKIKEMTIVIDALERLQESDYIQFPEGKSPKSQLKAIDEKGISQMVTTYHPEFGPDKVETVYQKAREDELKDRHLVYDTLRDKSPNWWD